MVSYPNGENTDTHTHTQTGLDNKESQIEALSLVVFIDYFEQLSI